MGAVPGVCAHQPQRAYQYPLGVLMIFKHYNCCSSTGPPVRNKQHRKKLNARVPRISGAGSKKFEILERLHLSYEFNSGVEDTFYQTTRLSYVLVVARGSIQFFYEYLFEGRYFRKRAHESVGCCDTERTYPTSSHAIKLTDILLPLLLY